MAGLGVDESSIDLSPLAALKEMVANEKLTAESSAIKVVVSKVYDKYIENLIQNFVHVMHNTFRIGGDSPFTNVSLFDSVILKTLFKDALYPDMSCPVDNIEEIMKIQKVFVEFFHLGVLKGKGKKYRFPVATINIKRWGEDDIKSGLCTMDEIGKIADYDFFKYIMSKNRPRGAFNIHVGSKIATCCRLTSDLSTLKDSVKLDSFGNGGMSLGSHRVVAINYHRLALKSKDECTGMLELLYKYLEMCEKCLVAHKDLLHDRVNSGFLKFFNINWISMSQLFSTIGYTGLWDAYSVLNPYDLNNYEAYVLQSKIYLEFMEDFARKAGQRNDGFAFNVEEIPAEGASPKMAAMDNIVYSDREWYKPLGLLSNQMIPLYEQVPLFTRLEIAGQLMNIVSGGAILHLNLHDDMTQGAYDELMRIIIEEYNIPHCAINRGTTTCVNGHSVDGIYQQCPICEGEIDTHTIRVVGFETDVKSWSPERREEFKRRQFYTGSNLLNIE